MRTRLHPLAGPLACGAALLATGCSFHTTATHWNGRVGQDGTPVYVKNSVNVGVNLLVLLPMAGNTTIDAMLDESTAAIASAGSDRVRVVQVTTNNYWYALPPLTWLVAPIVTEVVVEYVPSAAEQQQVAELHQLQAERAAARRESDRSHVIPDPPVRR